MQIEILYVLEVYQSGSFSQAAKNLFITQPALSIAIKKIEKRIGMPLFNRNTKPLELTPAGKLYIKSILEMKSLEENLTKSLDDLNGLEDGELRLAGTQYFNSHVIARTINNYSQRYPKVRLSLLEDNSGNLDWHLQKSQVDITLHCGNFDGKLYQGFPIFKDYLLLAVPKKMLDANNKIKKAGLSAKYVVNNTFLAKDCPYVPLASFKDLPFLILTDSNNLQSRALAMCERANFTPQVRFYVEQLETSNYLAGNGLGLTFVSDLLIKERPSSQLLYFKLVAPEATRIFHGVTKKHSYISRIMQEFLNMSREAWLGTVNYFSHLQ